MQFDQIIVVKETRDDERRVALTPRIVAQLISNGYKVLVENDAGLGAGFNNAEYVNVGAKILTLTSSGFPPNSFIVRLLRPSKERELFEYNLFDSNTLMLGFLFPFVDDIHISTWQSLGITTLSFDLFKSISIHDPKNAQAAMSKIAGRLAFHDILNLYKGSAPYYLSVIGTGAAGLSAVKAALEIGIPVQVFGRKENLRSEFEALKAIYRVISPAVDGVNFIRKYLAESTLIITAARIAGKKAPLLIDKESLNILPANTVIVDLAASNGGNVVGTQCEQTITTINNIRIRSVCGYPKQEPRLASEIYAQCVYSLISEIMSSTGNIDFKNNLIQELWVTHNNQRNNLLYNKFSEI